MKVRTYVGVLIIHYRPALCARRWTVAAFCTGAARERHSTMGLDEQFSHKSERNGSTEKTQDFS